MNCPNCKNPIQKYVSACEWCGASINSELLQDENIFVVEKYYKMVFKGIVLVGKFESSIVISEGDDFNYLLNGETLKAKVKSIELNGTLVSYYSGVDTIGILIH